MVCLAGMLVSVSAADGPAEATNEVARIHQLRRLTRDEAAGGRPVRLQGTVLCYDSGWNQLYLFDGEETGYFNPHDFPTEPKIGKWVEIKGTTTGDGENRLRNAKLTILGDKPIPAAKALALSQLAGDWCGWIETSGRVVSADTSRGRLALMLQERKQNCLVYVLGLPEANDFKRLMNRRVRVRGINASKVVDGRLAAASVFVPAINEITLNEPTEATPAPVPVVSIGSLLNRELGSWTNHPVHISGVVAAYQPAQSLVVKDPTGVIGARVIQLTQVQSDERVEVWGFLEVSANETLLDNAYFEVVEPFRQEPTAPQTGGGVAGGVAPPMVLTEVSDILKLRRDEAARHIPVKLRGVVTYSDPDWRNGFIQDKGSAVYVDLGQNDVRSGQWVELTGETSPGGFAPEVLNSRLKILATTNLPAPAMVDLEDLANGHLDAHWVEMAGVVRRADVQSGHVTLSLMTPKGRFKVIIPGFENKPAPDRLIDALVSVQGACTSELNARRQLSGITLHAPGLEQVRIIEPAPADPFAIATTKIEAVATFDPDRLAGRRVKINGIVTLKIPGQGFILEDASSAIRALTRQTNQARIGDIVEVLGFPAIGDFSPFLEEAAFRLVGAGSPPAPQKTTAEEILLQGLKDGLVVQIKARLLQSVPRSANPQLVLQDGPVIFMAQLEMQSRRQDVPALQSGSLLRLTGVCSIQGGERHEAETFRLLLREPSDVELLESAPWWTLPPRFHAGRGGMMLAIAAALAWVALLRRQVRTQTGLVRQKLKDEAALEERYRALFENANDMVYTHDLEGRITAINQSGERLLQRPRGEILSPPHHRTGGG